MNSLVTSRDLGLALAGAGLNTYPTYITSLKYTKRQANGNDIKSVGQSVVPRAIMKTFIESAHHFSVIPHISPKRRTIVVARAASMR